MHVAQVDHDYTQYYPLGEVYVSLYPQKSGAIGQEVTGVVSKPPMWKEVEKCMEEGTLSRLRNRAPNVSISVPSTEAGYVMKDKAADIDGGESEGGFFEE
jgi:hypothetical protein